jgi:hypothetical protein
MHLGYVVKQNWTSLNTRKQLLDPAKSQKLVTRAAAEWLFRLLVQFLFLMRSFEIKGKARYLHKAHQTDTCRSVCLSTWFILLINNFVSEFGMDF